MSIMDTMANPDFLARLATRLRTYRVLRGIKQTELAPLSQVALSTIRQIEQEQPVYPKISTLMKLAKALNCTLDDLTINTPPEVTAKQVRGNKQTNLHTNSTKK